MKIPRGIKRGDVVVVVWRDITALSTGPDEAELVATESPRIYYGRATVNGRDCILCAHDRRREWKGFDEWSGADAYPVLLIDEIRILERAP